MKHYILGNVVDEISEREKNPSMSGYERFVGLEHYVSGDIEIKKYGTTENLNSTMKVFKSGDILVARRNVYLKRASVVYFDGLTSGDSIVLRAKNENIGRILPFILNTSEFWDYANQHADGTMSKRLSPKVLKAYEFDLPDDNELERLADLLWSLVDTKNAYEELLIKTDDLVISQFIEMFGDPNEPEHPVPFEQAFIIRDDLRKPINNAVRAEMHEDAKYPYYGANGQIDTINEYLMDCTALCLAEDGGSYGSGEKTSYIVNGKCWVNNHAHVLIPRENCDIKYANSFFRVLDMSSYVSGTTRLKLTQRKMKEIPIILPDYNLQKEYADFVEQSDKSKFELQQAIESIEIGRAHV